MKPSSGPTQVEGQHCRNGHPYTPLNTGWDSDGYRVCLECAYRRGIRKARSRRRRLHSANILKTCRQGLHGWIPENLITLPSGGFLCRPCLHARTKLTRQRTTRLYCLAKGCQATTNRVHVDSSSWFVCARHRRNPPAVLVSLGLVARGGDGRRNAA